MFFVLLCFLRSKKQKQCKNAVFFALQKTKMRTFCFAEHFPLENVRQNAFLHQMHLMRTFCFAKMHFCTNKTLQMHFGCAKMHLMQKCIWCQNAFWRTFSKGKCSAVQKCIFASHFPKENVQLCKNAFLHHIFQRKMFSITFSKGKCSAPTKCYKCIWCQNAFDAYIL